MCVCVCSIPYNLCLFDSILFNPKFTMRHFYDASRPFYIFLLHFFLARFLFYLFLPFFFHPLIEFQLFLWGVDDVFFFVYEDKKSEFHVLFHYILFVCFLHSPNNKPNDQIVVHFDDSDSFRFLDNFWFLFFGWNFFLYSPIKSVYCYHPRENFTPHQHLLS